MPADFVAPSCPWLLVHGEADNVVPVGPVIEWCATLPAPPRLVLLPGVGHFFHGRLPALAQAVMPGHKIARDDIPECGHITNFGQVIGYATKPIAEGEHVHTQNVASSRGRGDLGPRSDDPLPRLAEPPDDPSTRNNGAPSRAINR